MTFLYWIMGIIAFLLVCYGILFYVITRGDCDEPQSDADDWNGSSFEHGPLEGVFYRDPFHGPHVP